MVVVDAQLPPTLATWLNRNGIPAQHVGDCAGDPSAADETIWSLASHPGWIIISKDQDFADRAILRGPPPLVIHLQLGNCHNRELIAHIQRCWPTIHTLMSDPKAALITVEWAALGVTKHPEQ